MKVINLQKTINTRDLGGTKTSEGYYIKYNRLIRSDKLRKINDEDINTLKDIGLVKVIDFRSEKEFVKKADIRIDNVEYINLPTFEKDVEKEADDKHGDSNLLQLVNKESGGKRLLLDTYKSLVTSNKAITAYQEFFKILTENKEGAILWHCSQGKDRAGLAAFYLEYALGVSFDECVNDYLYTNVGMKIKIKEVTPIVLKETKDPSLLPLIDEVFMALTEYLDTALNAIKENYESLDNYLINVLKVDIKALKENYLIKEL